MGTLYMHTHGVLLDMLSWEKGGVGSLGHIQHTTSHGLIIVNKPGLRCRVCLMSTW